MSLLIASDLHKDMAGRPLLRGVSFKLERRERMTIAGRNGAGKTTLLRMLSGQASIDRGELSLGRGVRVALHDQRPPREARGDREQLTLREYVLSGCAQELAAEARLRELEAEMAAGATDDAVLGAYASAQARLEALGGYLWRDRATVTSRGLGFGEEDLARPLHTFSGGQLTRASLARALATDAEVLLLDEPTNHLDIESLEWLEQTLVGLDAAVVLVAHDRWFLEAVGTSVLELQGGSAPRARFFAGPWHAWRQEQAARELAAGKASDAQRAEIARMQRFVERFRYKATKARQAQSRLKRLSKMQPIDGEAASSSERSLAFSFKAAERSGRVVFEVEAARVEVGGADGPPRVLLDGVEMWLERGEHVTLVGPNGSGKSTLIETLTGRRPLAAGRLSTGHNVTVGYLSQHSEELGAGGHPGESVLEAAQRATKLTPNKARALLGRFLFGGEEAEKPLDGLSGGERQRLSLAILMNGKPDPPNVLILDEPTNHLDLESREALEDALRSFDGAVLLVSHDRALLDAVGSRTIAIEDGGLRSYLGGWPEYVRVRDERRAAGLDGGDRAGASGARRRGGGGSARASGGGGSPRASGGGGGSAGGRTGAAQGPSRPGSGDGSGASTPRGAGASPSARNGGGRRASSGRPAEPSKNRRREQQKAERAVEAAEEALQALEQELSDPAAWATRYETAISEARHTAARRAVEQAYSELERLLG